MSIKTCRVISIRQKRTSVRLSAIEWEVFEKIMPYTDMFLYDIKCITEELFSMQDLKYKKFHQNKAVKVKNFSLPENALYRLVDIVSSSEPENAVSAECYHSVACLHAFMQIMSGEYDGRGVLSFAQVAKCLKDSCLVFCIKECCRLIKKNDSGLLCQCYGDTSFLEFPVTQC